MRKRELEKFEKLLLKLKKDLIEEIEKFERKSLSINVRERLGQVSAFRTHPADMSSVTDEQERSITIAEHQQMFIDAINAALFRIKQGTYGKCLLCGEAIENERLKAIPYAENCLKCQEMLEKNKPIT